MIGSKVRVSAVSYLNTLPFLYGMHQSALRQELDIRLDIPSDCAQKLLHNEVDIGLVPVAIIPELQTPELISNYCIGAYGPVHTVALFSDVPLEEITAVYLDYQSRTSVQLVQLLAREYWGIDPQWLVAEQGYEQHIQGSVAGVIIGDRTFNLGKPFNYKYDLSAAWKQHTGLPFVFACWVANKKLPKPFLEAFNTMLGYGVNRIDEVVHRSNHQLISKAQLTHYLKCNIDYHLDDQKRKAMDRFLAHLTA